MAVEEKTEQPEMTPVPELPLAEAAAVAALLEDWKDMDAAKITERIDADAALRALPLKTREKIFDAILAFQRKQEGKAADPVGPEQQEDEPKIGLGSKVRNIESGEESLVIGFTTDGRYIIQSESHEFVKREELVSLSKGLALHEQVRMKKSARWKYSWFERIAKKSAGTVENGTWDKEDNEIRVNVRFSSEVEHWINMGDLEQVS